MSIQSQARQATTGSDVALGERGDRSAIENEAGDAPPTPSSLAVVVATVLAPSLDAVAARAAGLAEDARAANTHKAYACDWAHFGA